MWLCIPVMINLDVRSHRLESMFGYILHVHWQHRLVRLKIGILLLAYQGAIARWGCHLLIPQEYFHDLESHRKDIIWEDEQDGEAIELAFSKKKIEARKSWLRHFEPGTYLDQKEKLIKYSDFVNKELILFSMADLQRSIPSITSDGQSIERTWYMPMIPMLVVNGSEGIKIGWSSNILNYSSRDIVANVSNRTVQSNYYHS
ncbi:hypothetical protein RHGRI_023400 [Rhododendron griersonianum]|uniref:DNA topoisomerase (ATP-hydrolyzing) n=1 Tax=Rhododendron griersonianum TaxID=479676 RepID=A0AAV6J3I4_9ERIC|nr:hypothetical protein RHGRI_023400 [Rhododendron griersonianum]